MVYKAKAFCHFFRSGFCKGGDQDLLRADQKITDQIKQTINDDGRFAGTRSGRNEGRTRTVADRLILCLIEIHSCQAYGSCDGIRMCMIIVL